ncbi:MAG: hypothetical protein KGI37_10640 [Alphaproteobacteria bacterium]|nr:hypothetical protein [Alphaproteobacteria bacterium]
MASANAQTTNSDTTPSGATTVLHPDSGGNYAINGVSRNDIQRVDISDIDLLITLKNGNHYLIPGGGIAAMSDHPPNIAFADGTTSAADMLSETGAALDLAVSTPMPASFKIQGAQEGGTNGKEQELAQRIHKLEEKLHQQQQKIEQQQKQLEHQKQQATCTTDDKNNAHGNGKDLHCKPENDHNQVAPLNTNTSNGIEQMVQNLQKIEDQLHNKDFDYVPPHQYAPPPLAPTPPPGVPPPISLTPIITLFMGNVVGTTETTVGSVNYFYGGGGATGSDASAQIGPRNALQWSAATITGDNNTDVIYAEGSPSLGNTFSPTNNAAISGSTVYYAKQFLLNVAGYFTTVNDVTIKGVPSGVSIVGATNEGGGVWTLPSVDITKQNPFTIVYNTDATGTFTLEFDVSGTSTRGATFNSVQTVEFQYAGVTNSSQVTDPTLVYDAGGYTKEIYVLPTLDQPNIITAGDGNDTVYGSQSNDTITLGNGNDTVVEGNGNSTITVGDGIDTITAGDGNNTVVVGAGYDTLTLGNGNNSITTGGGGGVISLGTGNNTLTVNSASGSTNGYTINATGGGTTTINGGDDSYAITTATGVDNFTLGAGNDTITTSGGGGTISTGSGNQTFNLNTASGSKDNYRLTTTGTGTTRVTAGDGNYTIIAGNSGASTISIGSGTSSITATTGTGLVSIATGNGNMTIAAGAGAGDNVVVGTDAAVANTVAVSVGDGAGDSITTDGSSGSTGTLAIGSGAGDTITADSGSYTITVGGSNGTTNTMTLASGANDTVTAGNGNNTLYIGSSTSGTDTITLGNGNNTVYVGTGTNSISAGTGNNILNFSNITTALTIDFGTTGTSTATGTGVSDSFTGFATIYGTNYGDTITLNTGNLTVYAGSGNDTITLGSGTDIVYAGNGNNTITGRNSTTATGNYLYGGTGNNTFTNPDAGTTYDGTNGVNLTLVANNTAYTYTDSSSTNPFVPGSTATVTNAVLDSYTDPVNGATSSIIYSYASGVATINVDLGVQLNKIDYSHDTSGLTIDLAIGEGLGTGGTASGSTYAFTPTNGYNSINDIWVGSYSGSTGNILTPSYSDTLLVGNTSHDTFIDTNTLSTQTVILVGGGTNGTGADVFDMGAAHEIVIENNGGNGQLYYNNSPAGIVVNLDSSSHTFSNTLYSSPITVAAYSGSNWGADAANSDLSWSTGDYYVPVSGTSSTINQVVGSYNSNNLVYGGSNFLYYYNANPWSNVSDYIYFGSGGGLYSFSWGNDVVVGHAGSENVFNTNSNFNVYVILDKALDPRTQDAGVNLASGGTTYDGFAYGWNNAASAGSNYTLLSNMEYVLGGGGNTYVVGDNNGDQINARTGSNTIILGDGINIVTAIQGTDTITSAAGNPIGTNTLNFETNNDSYSGVMGGWSGSGANTSVEAFLNYSGTSTQSTFFGAGGDATAFFGNSALASAYQARTGTSGYSYDSVQAGIISTLNGSDYSSNTANSATTHSTFVYDNVYSGAANIIGHAGGDIFIDNIGTAAESFNGSADNSNVYYLTGSQIPDVTVTGGGTGVLDILRIEGGTPTNLSTLVGDSAQFTGIDVVDLRSGTDTVTTSSTTITMGAGSTAQSNAYTLSDANMESLTHVTSGGSATIILKLDSGDTFTASTTAPAGDTATVTHSSSAYFGDIYTYTNTTTHTTTTVDIHYGTG